MRRVAVFVVAATVSSVFFIDFCNLIYACGCKSLWAGAAESCNIHTHGAKHCPFCAIGTVGSYSVWGVIVVVQGLVAFSRLDFVSTLLGSLAAFPVTAGVLAVALGLWMGYWS